MSKMGSNRQTWMHVCARAALTETMPFRSVWAGKAFYSAAQWRQKHSNLKHSGRKRSHFLFWTRRNQRQLVFLWHFPKRQITFSILDLSHQTYSVWRLHDILIKEPQRPFRNSGDTWIHWSFLWAGNTVSAFPPRIPDLLGRFGNCRSWRRYLGCSWSCCSSSRCSDGCSPALASICSCRRCCRPRARFMQRCRRLWLLAPPSAAADCSLAEANRKSCDEKKKKKRKKRNNIRKMMQNEGMISWNFLQTLTLMRNEETIQQK